MGLLMDLLTALSGAALTEAGKASKGEFEQILYGQLRARKRPLDAA
jgi:hypothetical protein